MSQVLPFVHKGGQANIYCTVDMTKAYHKVNHWILLSNSLVTIGLLRTVVCSMVIHLKEWTFCKYLVHYLLVLLSASGVPQGRILGPLPFLIFVKDLASCIKHTPLLFVDDIKFFTVVKVVDDCGCLQRDIDSILARCVWNGLFLNE